MGVSFGCIESKNFTTTDYRGNVLAFYSLIREIRLSFEFQEMGVSRTLETENAQDLKENYWHLLLFTGSGLVFIIIFFMIVTKVSMEALILLLLMYFTKKLSHHK